MAQHRLLQMKINHVCCIAIVFLAIIFLSVDLTDACSCEFLHPQQHACKSDFVIAATIQREHKVSQREIAYKFRLRRTFKAVPDAKEILQYGRILTPAHDSECGIRLEVNKTYLLTGHVVYGKENFISECRDYYYYTDSAERSDHGSPGNYLQNYGRELGCACELSKRGKSRLFRSGLYPTPNSEPMCKVEINKGSKKYARGTIKTMKAVINICNFKEEWSRITKRQQKGFRKLYYHGCDCEISKGYQPHIPGCNYAPFSRSQCEYNHGICLPNKYGLCNWSQNLAQNRCVMEAATPKHEMFVK